MNKSIFYILLLTALPLYFTGCRKEVRPTSMTIIQSNLQQHQECRRSGSPHPDFRQYAPKWKSRTKI